MSSKYGSWLTKIPQLPINPVTKVGLDCRSLSSLCVSLYPSFSLSSYLCIYLSLGGDSNAVEEQRWKVQPERTRAAAARLPRLTLQAAISTIY